MACYKTRSITEVRRDIPPSGVKRRLVSVPDIREAVTNRWYKLNNPTFKIRTFLVSNVGGQSGRSRCVLHFDTGRVRAVLNLVWGVGFQGWGFRLNQFGVRG